MRKILVLALLLSSCATYSPGRNAQILQTDSKEQVGITAQVDSDMSFENLHLINFYFSNPTSGWMRIKNIEILDVEKNPDIRVIVGKDLYSWAKAMEHKISIDNYNRELFWGALAIAGTAITIAGSNSNSPNSTKVGVALTVGSLITNEIQDILKNVSDIERASLVPQEHLYSPFSIPPHLVSTKWILFQKINPGRICKIKIKVTYIDNTSTIFNSNVNTLNPGCFDEEA